MTKEEAMKEYDLIPKPTLEVRLIEGGVYVLMLSDKYILGQNHDRLIFEYANRIADSLGISRIRRTLTTETKGVRDE